MSISIQEAKSKAKRVAQRLKDMGYPLSQAQALEVVATVYGDLNWHALKARLAKASRAPAVEISRAAQMYVFGVTLFAEDEEGNRNWVEAAYVVAEQRAEAENVVAEMYWDADFDRAQYRQVFEVSSSALVEPPAFEFLLDWLVHPNQIEGVAKALQSINAVPVGVDAGALGEKELAKALVKAAASVETISELLRAIYAELKPTQRFVAEEDWVFEVGCEILNFKGFQAF
jgi:hypothetical protein